MNDLTTKLKAPPAPEAPFLHARIMNAVRATEPARTSWKPLWATAAIAVVIVTAVVLTLNQPKKSSELSNVTIPTIELPQIPATFQPLPIESELENLKADTRNAARALAACFLPAQD